MTEGTVRGAFELDTGPAVRNVRSYRKAAAEADAQTRQLGAAIDDVFGPTTTTKIRTTREEISGLGTTTRDTRKVVVDNWRGMRREIQREAAGIVSTVAVVRDRVRELGREHATPVIDLDGIAKALSQVELLQTRLAALGATRVSAGVGIGGGGFGSAAARASAGAGGGRGGGSGLLSLGGVGFAGIRGRTLVGAGALALPAVQSLGGAAVGLVGSGGSAALGAGATGLGGLGPLLAGIGGVMSVAKPAQAALKEVMTAQDAVTKAVREYGRGSEQAAKAQRELNRLRAVAGPGSGYAAQQARGFGADWRRLSAPARQQYYGFLGDAAQIGRRAAPGLASNALTATTAFRSEGTQFARFLAGPQMQDNLAVFTRVFARELPTAERTLENVVVTMTNLSRAAIPFFHEANVWTRNSTAGWRSQSSDIAATRDKMRPLVESAKDWAHLTGSTFDLLRDISRLGRPSGDSLVVSLDGTIQRWDAWINSHPEETGKFFSDAAKSTRDMASGLSGAVHYAHQLADALQPLLDRFSQLVGFASSLGLIGTPGAIAGLVGGVRGFRGGGAGAAGGGTAAFAGGAGGGAAAGGGAGAAALGYLAARGVGSRGRISRGPGIATPEAFAQRYGSVAGARYGMPVSAAGARTSLRTGRIASGLRGAGRAFLPITLGLGALDFASYDGGFADRAQAAASSATFGLVNRPRTQAQASDAGGQRAQGFVSDLSSDPRAAMAAIQRRLATVRGKSFHEGGGWTNPFGGKDFSGSAAESGLISGSKAAEVRSEIKELSRAYRDHAQTVRSLDRAERSRLDDLSKQRAAQYGGGLSQAYGVYRRAGSSPMEAAQQTAGQVRDRLSKTRDAGVETLGEASLDWARALKRGNPALAGVVDDVTKSIEQRFKRMGKRVQIVNGDILTGARAEWRQIRDAISDPVEQARERTSADFTAIQQKALGSLVAMGMDRGQARQLLKGAEGGDARSQAALANPTGLGMKTGVAHSGGALTGATKARGGVVRGAGLMDTVPMGDSMVAPGEAWVANRHTLARLSLATRAVYGLTAEQMITGETRRHAMPGLATGGRAGVTGAVGNLAAIVTGQFPGTAVTSTTGGRHAAGSYHYRGLAADIGGPAAVLNRAAAWVGARYGSSLAEGIHNPNLSVRNGRTVPPASWGASTWADHADHIHLALAGALGAGAAGVLAGGGGGLGSISVSGVGRRQGGLPGLARQRAGDIYAAALTRRLNASLGAGGVALGGGGGSWASMVAAVGLPAIFNRIISAESGGNPNAVNPSGASGLTQIMMPLHAGLVRRFGGNVFDPMTNLRVARSLYDSAGLSPWASSRGIWGGGKSRGGPVKFAGAFDKGGSFTTNGATEFVAGEGPRNRRETVKITPASQTSDGEITVIFQAGAIVVGGGHDAEAVGEQVAAKILAAIRRGRTASVIA